MRRIAAPHGVPDRKLHSPLMASILYVDDEPSIGVVLHDVLTRAGHKAHGAATVVEALQVLARETIDLIISDYRMPGLNGLEFLQLLQQEGYEIPVVMVTGYGTIEHAVTAIKAGAVDYVTKPIRAQQLELAVDQALEFVRLKRENDKLHRELMQARHEREIVGDSASMRRILQTLATVAPTRATVLLQGESGTGKELIARAIHDQSDRRGKPFVKLNCAALPDGLIESALFGHEKGAFTGAVKRVEGAFERANGGSLLLDEISEMKLELQAKLLRVLQEQEFERVGGSSAIRVDVRVIATTNRDLAARAASGDFRQDLYYRLAVVPIVIPPLRERTDDIPPLAYRFAVATAAEIGKELRAIAPETLQLLQSYPWPGNVRELQHAVERAVILSSDPVLMPHAFEAQRLGGTSPLAQQALRRTTPTGIAISVHGGGTVLPPNAVVLTSFNVNEAERILIERALQATGNNRTRTAELLGISVRTLRNKLNGPGSKAGRIREVA
jgi:DNA-binding NtrC family response regulator